MSVVVASRDDLEFVLPNSGKALVVSSDLLAIVRDVELRQGFSLSSDAPPFQAKIDVVKKLLVLREVNLHLDTREAQQQLFWFGLYYYWLPPKELDMLAVPLMTAGFMTRMEYNRLSRERVTLINYPQSRRR